MRETRRLLRVRASRHGETPVTARVWLMVIGVIIGVFGVWAGSTGFVLFGLMLFVVGAFLSVAIRATSSGREEDRY